MSLAPGRLIGNSAVYTLGNVVPQAMNMFLLTVFSRYLSPAEFGIFAYTTSICSFLAIVGHLSLQSYLARHWADCGAEDARRRLLGTMFAFVLVYNAVLLALELVALPVIFRALDAQVPFEPYMRLALLSTVIEIIGAIPLAYFLVREQAARFVSLALSQTLLSGGLSFYLVVVAGTGVLGRYYGALGANLVLLVAYLAIIARVGAWAWDWARIRHVVAFSLPLSAAALLALMTTMSDRLILERFVSLDQLGVYALGFSIAYGLNSLSSGVRRAIEPQVYRLERGGSLDAQTLAVKRYVVLLLVGLGAGMIALSREILTILAGPPFYESYKIVALLTTAVVLQGIMIPAATYAVATGKNRYVPLVNLAGAAASVGVNLVAIPRLGIYGATVGSITASLVTLYAYRFVTELGARIRWRFERDLLLMAVTFAASALILQIETPVLVLSLMVKMVLVGAPMLLLAWRQTGLRRPRVA